MKVFLTIAALFIFSLSSFAGDWQKFMLESSGPMLSSEISGNAQTLTGKQKNPKLSFILSAAIPGAGQVYVKSYLKAAAFVAVEAAAWGYYVNQSNEGDKIDAEFRAYANEHWSETEYWRWIANQSGIAYSEDSIEALRDWERQSFSHGLHREKDQQYYEMIGKYHQFSWGWDDFRENNSISITDSQITQNYNETKELNDNRRYYELRRLASNAAFKRATTGATIAVFNHLISAIDAAWTTTKFNKKIKVSFRLEPIYYAQETHTALTLRMTW